MANIDQHPTVLALREKAARQDLLQDKRSSGRREKSAEPLILDAQQLRKIAMDAGADDVGFVSIDRAELDDQRDDIMSFFPKAKTLLSFVCKMHREPIRSTARSVANLEFHHAGDQVNEVGRRVVAELENRGVAAVNPAMGFPMEMDRFPGKIWVVSQKPVAVAAGLGKMGIHRNVIHPKFGNFVLLGTVLLECNVDEESQPIDYNPCLECRLCVAACPVGAISHTGGFNFSACYAHNYREFMGGFTDWVETVAESHSAKSYREKVDDSESGSMWQSLSFGANYKAAYCLSVCPAGEDVIAPFLTDRGEFLAKTLKPLQQKKEMVYVQPNTDAEDHVKKRFPHKTVKHVGAVLRPTSIEGFVRGMHLVFQPGKSKGLEATYHFQFSGAEEFECTVTIKNQTIEVRDGLVEKADLRIRANSKSWLRFLRKEANIAWLLATFRIRLKGSPRLLLAFGKCFP